MNRLDYLTALRSRIDLEIERETAYQRRMVQFRTDYRTHVSRDSWTTRIITMTAAHFGIDVEDMVSARRTRKYLDARHVAFWLLHDAGRGYAETGRRFGKDHSTVINGKRRVDNSPELQEVAAAVKRALNGDEEGAA